MAEYLCEEDMNTGEYISRDVALRQLNATCLATGCNNYKGVMCRACAYADAMDVIEAIPAADVQPVKHGKWGHGWEHGKCTNCEKSLEDLFEGDFYYDCEELHFCPNCGARLDGDKNE